MTTWKIFQGTPENPHDEITRLPEPPSWRSFDKEEKGITYQVRQQDEIELVNAALYLRRPLLVSGKPGIGKTSLAYAIAQELNLGKVLRWNITTRSNLQQGLYSYDAIGRLQDGKARTDESLGEIGKYIQLGPLGTALRLSSREPRRPRVLLIDEIDKSDIDLPNDLLNVFEEGEFEIPELARIADKVDIVNIQTYDNESVPIENGKIQCEEFPFIVLTSNGEREFPPAFLRRCIRLDLSQPSEQELGNIVKAHFHKNKSFIDKNNEIYQKAEKLIENFCNHRNKGELATDQLLNAIYILTSTATNDESPDLGLESIDNHETNQKKQKLIELLWRYLSS